MAAMPPRFVAAVSLAGGGGWVSRVDDVEAVSALTADANVVWVVPCLDQKQNIDTQILSDLENIIQLIVQRPDVKTAEVSVSVCQTDLITVDRFSDLFSRRFYVFVLFLTILVILSTRRLMHSVHHNLLNLCICEHYCITHHLLF